MIKAINRVVDWLENVAMTIAMLIATVIAIIQVVARYVFHNSLSWSEETILYTLIIMSFVAASMGVRYGAHISVEVLSAFSGPRVTRILQLISYLLGVVFALTLLYYGWQVFENTKKMRQLSPAMRIPVAYIYLSIPISAGFMLLRYLLLLQLWKERKEINAQSSDLRAA